MENNLVIQNFKCFIHQEIPLKSLTVLAGSNSVGKSSVIQSILLLRLAQEKIKSGLNKIPLNGEYALGLGNSFNVTNREMPSEPIRLEFNYNNHKEIQTFFADAKDAQVYLDMMPKVPNLKNKGFHPPLDHPILKREFHYLNAERLGPRPFYNVTDGGKNVGHQGENAISLLSSSIADTPEYDVPKDRMFPKTENPRIRHQSEAWMNYIIPGIKIDAKKIQETNLSYVQYGGNTPHNVGFGISYVLPIVVAGLIAQNGEMLVVENPEAHLHPSGQSAIGRFLATVAASGVQVLIETHSEHVINGILISSVDGTIIPNDVIVNFLDKKDNSEIEVNPIEINKVGDLTSYPKGFFDQQQIDFAEIVAYKRNILNSR